MIANSAVGAYSYDKRYSDGQIVCMTVEVYPLAVASQGATWPEQSQRRTAWLSVSAAASAVDEDELKMLISKFAP